MDNRISNTLPAILPHEAENSQQGTATGESNARARGADGATALSPLEQFRKSPQFAALLARRRGAASQPQAVGMPHRSPQEPAPPIVPPRLQAKIDAIDIEKLKVLNPDLTDYAVHQISMINSGKVPDARSLALDIKHLPLFAEMENQRNPGLNLLIFSSTDECIGTILKREQVGATQNFRVVYRPSKHTGHHVALDVHIESGKPTSIVGYESALDRSIPLYKEDLELGIPNSRVAFVPNIIQSSEYDCAMFSLSHALKSFKAGASFTTRIHRQAATYRDIKDSEIPAIFMKHAHSRTIVDKSVQGQTIVTKTTSGKVAETLTQRVNAYRTRRPQRDYSTSIEGFRLQEIARLQEYLSMRSAPHGV